MTICIANCLGFTCTREEGYGDPRLSLLSEGRTDNPADVTFVSNEARKYIYEENEYFNVQMNKDI